MTIDTPDRAHVSHHNEVCAAERFEATTIPVGRLRPYHRNVVRTVFPSASSDRFPTWR
ncbi:MAG: hypothetical protein K0S86_200 [Geminicoccaceae bacterium]|nr:hypothetical protein [Geminicoccaceae bacterium]